MVELSVLVIQFDGRCRVCLRGELDMSTAWRLRQDLATAWGVVEFDCSELTFVDSSGIASWMERLNHDGSVVLINASPQTKKLLDICGLSQQFELRTEAAPGERELVTDSESHPLVS
jgi:anti-anti-sigma factor